MNDPVKAKIIELVPEIKALPEYPYNPDAAKAIVALEKFAMKTLWNGDIEHTATYMIENYRQQREADYRAMLEGKYEGRPITLADVLRAILKVAPRNKTLVTLECDGQFITHNYDKGGVIHQASETWNLTTDYDGQTPELKAFVGKLLGV